MEAPSSQSPSLSASGSGIKKVFGKKSRNNSVEDSLHHRSSIDSTERSPDKSLSLSTSHDSSSKSSAHKVSKFISGRSKRKGRKGRNPSELGPSAADEERGRSLESNNTPFELLPPSANQSTSSLNNDGGSSLLTDDSEPESGSARPTFTTRDSHVGYLTTSSPLITATTVDSPPHQSASTNPAQIDGSIPEIRTEYALPTHEEDSARPATSGTLTQVEPASGSPLFKTDTLSIPGSGTSEKRRGSISGSIRSISPGRKLKEAFTVNGGGKSAHSSPERDPHRSSVTGGVGGLLNKSRAIASRRAVKGEDTGALDSQKLPSSTPSITKLDTTAPPKTPPTGSVDTPLTTVTPPTPTEPKTSSPNSSPRRNRANVPQRENDGIVVSPSGNMISHRRTQSAHQPSKLSTAVSAPLTPMTEESSKTPTSQKNSNIPTGFFSSWMSATTNAVNSITNITTGTRSRSGTAATLPEQIQPEESRAEETIEPEAEPFEKKERTVDTLGMGDLNFGHLGLDANGASDEKQENINPELTDLKGNPTVARDEAAARLEDARAARAVSAAYEKPSRESSILQNGDDSQSVIRHRETISSVLSSGDRTPPNGSIFEGEAGAGIKRTSSARSRLASRRNRGSSGATGVSAIGALIGGSASTLANPASGPKLTGFAVAPKARNRSFHQLFRSVPDDDYLIEDYSCALQRDILLAGRIYISEGHICFSSNILGWVTTLVISFDEVMSIEKESTAMVFPNAIAVQTLHARHTFRSLLSRDTTYDLMIGIWKVSHPGTYKSSLNGIQLETGTGDKTEKTADAEASGDSETEDEEDIYDEDAEDEEAGSFADTGDGSIAGSEVSAPPKVVSRKPSALNGSVSTPTLPYPSGAGDVAQGEKVAAVVSEATGNDFPGPPAHAPTECTDSATHYEKILKDESIPAPLGKVYTMIFGPVSPVFISNFLSQEQKVTELQFDDKKGLSNDSKSRQYSYIKPLGGAIGPKQTKCITTENLDFFDLEKSISVTCSTQTPDVPNGNSFVVKTRYCLSWAPGNATRIQINCTIEWSAKSWLKGPIEKGAIDGQTAYGNDLVKSLKAGMSSRPRAVTNGSKAAKGKKRRKGDPKAPTSPQESKSSHKTQSGWGILEPVHGIISPIIDLAGSLLSANAVIIILLALLVFTWIRGPVVRNTTGINPSLSALPSSARLAAYEEMWRKEESELWSWLQDRTGMEGLTFSKPGFPSQAGDGKHSSARSSDKTAKEQAKQRSKILASKQMAARLREEKMSDREVEDAIRVTQERLDVLKGVVDKKKSKHLDKANEKEDIVGTEPGKET